MKKLWAYLRRKKPVAEMAIVKTPAQVPVNCGVKVLRGIISQSGEDAPTIVLLENQIGPITLKRENKGNYTMKRVDGFPVDKTFLMINHGVPGAAEMVMIHNPHNKTVQFSTRHQQNHQTNDGILNTSIEIRIYD